MVGGKKYLIHLIAVPPHLHLHLLRWGQGDRVTQSATRCPEGSEMIQGPDALHVFAPIPSKVQVSMCRDESGKTETLDALHWGIVWVDDLPLGDLLDQVATDTGCSFPSYPRLQGRKGWGGDWGQRGWTMWSLKAVKPLRPTSSPSVARIITSVVWNKDLGTQKVTWAWARLKEALSEAFSRTSTS